MWFRRAPKNRRLAREHVLDVKLRSSQVRARRMRTTAMVLGGFFVAVALIFLGWRGTVAALNVLLYENNAFAVRNVDVQTDGVIAPDQLRRWSGVRPGQNLFALDLAGVERHLLMTSMIRSVAIEKILPHTLSIRVMEREPVAQLSIARPRPGGGLDFVPLYLDEEAYVIQPLLPSQCSASVAPAGEDQLPTIVGVTPGEALPGRKIDSPQIRGALELILAFQRSSMQGLAELARVDVSSPEVLMAKTVQGSEITFGLAQINQQLLRWQAVFEKAQSMNKAIATMDLAVSNSIPSVWIDAGAVPQVSVHPPKPLRNKKKHV